MDEPVAPTSPPSAVPLPAPRLPLRNLVPMLVWGVVFQALTSSTSSVATVAAWVCLLPLLVLGRTASLSVAVVGGFVVVFVGRAVGLGVGVDAAVVAGAVVVVMLAHRVVYRELPVLGALAAPCAVVVVEYLASRFSLPGATALSLSVRQAADVPLFRWVDVVTPLGISFAIAWVQAILAGFGESFLVFDPVPQHVRERGLFIATSVCFAVVAVAHVVGFFIDDAVGSGSHVDVVAGVAGVGLVVLVVRAANRKPLWGLSPRRSS